MKQKIIEMFIERLDPFGFYEMIIGGNLK